VDSPWEMWRHCLGFESLKYLYELPTRQDEAYDAEDNCATISKLIAACLFAFASDSQN